MSRDTGDDDDDEHVVKSWSMQGFDCHITSNGYMHLAAYVDGDRVWEGHDYPTGKAVEEIHQEIAYRESAHDHTQMECPVDECNRVFGAEFSSVEQHLRKSHPERVYPNARTEHPDDR